MKVNIPAAAQTSPSASTAPGPGPVWSPPPVSAYVGAVSALETDEDRARMRNETQQDVILLDPPWIARTRPSGHKWNAQSSERRSR